MFKVETISSPRPNDSFAPAHSALGGPSPAANSFRHYPSAGSPQSGEGEKSAALLRDAATGRLSVQTVERLHRLLGGDARVEGMVLQFIADRYGARTLLHLPPNVAREILKRPADFVQAAKNHCEPELAL